MALGTTALPALLPAHGQCSGFVGDLSREIKAPQRRLPDALGTHAEAGKLLSRAVVEARRVRQGR